jgi:hypothetical protein
MLGGFGTVEGQYKAARYCAVVMSCPRLALSLKALPVLHALTHGDR